MVGEPYARELLGAEILVSDDNDSYGVVAAEFWAYRTSSVRRAREEEVRKAPLEVDLGASRSTEWGNRDEEYKKLEEDLKRLRGELEELTEEGAKRIGRMHREYLWARPPDPGEEASAGYRMRTLTSLEVWNKWPKVRLHLRRRPELGLDGTNNASERAIGKSKVRYETMRGYKKSDEGMSNGVVLTQWLYSGEDEHDLLAEVMAA